MHQRPAHNGALYIYSLRLYFACSPPAALASCTAARRVQDCDSRPPVLVRQAPGYLADDCPLVADARVRLLTLEHSLSVGCSAVLDIMMFNQSINQSKHISIAPYVATNQRRRTTSLEQSAAQSQTMWAVIRPVQAVTEDIFIRTVRPWRSALNTNILTYLLFILLRFLPKRVNRPVIALSSRSLTPSQDSSRSVSSRCDVIQCRLRMRVCIARSRSSSSVR